jgi:hypothetical protein
MTAKITASTSSGLVLDSDMSGSLALVANGITVATLNGTGANAGFQMGTSMAPAFSVYNSTTQTITNNTNTKVSFNTKLFDTNGNFDSTTNYRFTPTVAGYYQFNLMVRDNTGPASGQFVSYLYKNGSTVNFGVVPFAGSVGASSICSALIYLNGSTDYVEAYVSQNSGSSITISYSGVSTYFTGFLARSA